MATAIGKGRMIENARHPEVARFLLEKSIEFGKFLLSSQQESDYYCDTKMSTFLGEGAILIADAILDEISGIAIDAVGGKDMGATPIAVSVAIRSHQIGNPIPSFTVRKEPKEHGTRKRVEGPIPAKPSRILIVDDVVTSGNSIIDAVNVVRDLGHTVVMAICVLDREAGAGEKLRAMRIPYQPLVTVSELGIADTSGQSRSHRGAG